LRVGVSHEPCEVGKTTIKWETTYSGQNQLTGSTTREKWKEKTSQKRGNDKKKNNISAGRVTAGSNRTDEPTKKKNLGRGKVGER